MTYKHKGADGESFYNGIVPPTLNNLTNGGEISQEQIDNAKDVGAYSRTIKDVAGSPEVFNQYPDGWQLTRKNLIHKFLFEHIPLFRKGESVKAKLPFGTIYAGPEGWFVSADATTPSPGGEGRSNANAGASFGRV